MSAIIRGSQQAIAQQTGKSLAQTFVGAEAVIICDCSGSMNTPDSRGGKTRYDVACEELQALQGSLPGKIALISFNNLVMFNPAGEPMIPSGGTDLAAALQYCKRVDVEGIRFVLLSDGEPDQPDKALGIARTYKNRIDVVYVGPEDRPAGRDYLQRLAAVSGGQIVTADRAKSLAAATQKLLAAV